MQHKTTPKQAHHNILRFTEPVTKALIEQSAAEAVAEFIEGGDIITLAERISIAAHYFEAIRKSEAFIDAVRTALDRNGAPVTTTAGLTIEPAETGTSYDYSHDGEWAHAKHWEEHWAGVRKAREEKLRAIRPGREVVDEATGEVMVGPAKKSRSNYKITIPKI